MKRIIVVIALLVLVISIGILGIYKTNKICNEIQTMAIEIKDDIDNDDLEKAKEKAEILDDKWTNKEKILKIFLRRVNLDEISKQMYGLKGWMDIEDKTEANAALTVIIDVADDIKDVEIPTIFNIL